MNTCPCCDSQLLPHIRNHRAYWFCPDCWQEMPSFYELVTATATGRQKTAPNLGAIGLMER